MTAQQTRTNKARQEAKRIRNTGTPNEAALAILRGYADDTTYLDYTPHLVTALREQGYRL